MARTFLTNIDLVQNQLLNPVIQNLASAPSAPLVGQIYFDTTKGQFGVYTASGWVYLTGASGSVQSVTAGNSTITVGGTTSAPTITVTAGGLNHTYIADFQSTVNATSLSSFAVPTGAISMNSQQITGMADPTTAQGAATKNYVDSTSQGLSVKSSVVAATTAALPANTYQNGTNGVGATLTATSSAVLTVDGVSVTTGQRILVMNEATSANNGIYVVSNPGTSTAPYVLTRSSDFESASQVPGSFVFVESGTSNGDAGFVVSSGAGAYTMGTTGITWTQFSGAGEIQPGTGLTKTGNTIALASPVSIANGGTGSTSAVGARAALGAPGKYAATIGDGTSTSFVVTHGLNTLDVIVTIYNNTSLAEVEADVVHTSTTVVTVTFTTAPAASQFRVVVVG